MRCSVKTVTVTRSSAPTADFSSLVLGANDLIPFICELKRQDPASAVSLAWQCSLGALEKYLPTQDYFVNIKVDLVRLKNIYIQRSGGRVTYQALTPHAIQY